MKHESKEVKLKKQVVAVIDVPVYETVDEIAEALKAEEIIALINRQIATDMTNAERGKHRESAPGKKKRYETAFNLFPSVTFNDGETGLQKLTAIASDPDEGSRKSKLDALLASPEVEAAVTAKLGPAT